MHRIIKYYSEITRLQGKRVKGASIHWFYQNLAPERMNLLSRAYLGIGTAMDQLGEEPLSDRQRRLALAICKEGRAANGSQQAAVLDALQKKMTIIQGPPGTGKTATIVKLLQCIRRLYPQAKIAIVSSNHEAINNIVEKMDEHPELRDAYMTLGNQGDRRKFGAKLTESDDPELAEEGRRLTDENANPKAQVDISLLDRMPVVFSTIHSLLTCFGQPVSYDFVIMDETSQVSPSLGLLTMSVADHLVLFGDTMQLPPIYTLVETEEIRSLREAVEEPYQETGSNSFMSACAERFQGVAGMHTLRQHYRCHPGIIGFCNSYFYQNQLEICREDDGRLPIRVRWYEGTYWEKQEQDQGKPSLHYNMRQIAMFLEEELPILEADGRLADENYSICIISPFRHQLELLRQGIKDYFREKGQKEQQVTISDKERERAEKTASLTIHKSQGREYDLVYYMSVVDDGGPLEQWVQRDEMINVTISRAKNEFVLLCSSRWLPEEVQLQKLGYVQRLSPSSQGALRNFVAYVAQNQKPTDKQYGFGLVRSEIHSIFDRVSYFRMMESSDKRSAPELCFYAHQREIEGMGEGFELHAEVNLQQVEHVWEAASANEELTAYLTHYPRFDFVIARDDEIQLIVEVDGAFHRTEQEAQERDAYKDAIVAGLGEEFSKYRYLRLPVDGTSRQELELIRRKLEAAEDAGCGTPKLLHWGGNRMIHLLNQKFARANEIMMAADNEERLAIVGKREGGQLNYGNASETDYQYDNELLDACYFWRFGYAYAFEYSLILKEVLRDYQLSDPENPFVGMCDFGCGSMIAAWSLAYAKKQLVDEGICPEDKRLLYEGVDLTRWALNFEDDPVLKQQFYTPNSLRFVQKSLEEYFGDSNKSQKYNIWLFSKVLNEQNEELVDSLLNAISSDYLEGKRTKIYYLCFSHSKKRSNDGCRIAAQIIDRINVDNDFEVSTEFFTDSNLIVRKERDDGYPLFESVYQEEDGRDRYPYLYSLDSNFARISFAEVQYWRDREIDKICETTGKSRKEANEEIRFPITTTSTLAFQIIKLTRRQEN